MKAWVLHPADATLHTVDLVRVRARGAVAEIWVAMLVGRGTRPRGKVRGAGLDSVLDLDEATGASVSYDRARQRVQIQRSRVPAAPVKR